MIGKISFLKKIQSKALYGIQYCKRFMSERSQFKMKTLNQDKFERSVNKDSPEILWDNPGIIEGKFNSGVNDERLMAFSTEYRAYNFEGYESKFPNSYVCIDSKGDRRLKPHIYLNMVAVKPDFARQGVYLNAMRELAEAAKLEKGCEGRIVLDARKIYSDDFVSIPSPSLAHWKCGFRFIDEEKNRIMQKVLMGELSPADAPEGTMYYAFI